MRDCSKLTITGETLHDLKQLDPPIAGISSAVSKLWRLLKRRGRNGFKNSFCYSYEFVELPDYVLLGLGTLPFDSWSLFNEPAGR